MVGGIDEVIAKGKS